MNAALGVRKQIHYPVMSSLELISEINYGATKCVALRRVELKINADAVDALNSLAEQRNISRSELIEQMLLAQLAHSQDGF